MTEHWTRPRSSWSDDRLDEILTSLPDHLEVPERREIAAETAPIGRQRLQFRRRRWIAAGIAAALLVVGLATTPVRDTVADWFGDDDDKRSDQPQPDPKLPPEKAKPKR